MGYDELKTNLKFETVDNYKQHFVFVPPVQANASAFKFNHFTDWGLEVAKTMLVLMVCGLFNNLQFAYAQFPCADLLGEMLYKIFWEAVRRFENCRLKVKV